MRFKTHLSAKPPPVQKPRKPIDASFMLLLGLTLSSGLAVAVLHGLPHTVTIALETLGFIAILTPKVLAGVFIAATLPLVLPRERVAQWIGRDSGLRGLVIAAAAGAAIPGGPMMTFPLAAGFATVGADAGALVAFVSGWSLLGLNRTLIWEFSFLPAGMVWTRVGLSLFVPVLLGLLVRLIWRRGLR